MLVVGLLLRLHFIIDSTRRDLSKRAIDVCKNDSIKLVVEVGDKHGYVSTSCSEILRLFLLVGACSTIRLSRILSAFNLAFMNRGS